MVHSFEIGTELVSKNSFKSKAIVIMGVGSMFLYTVYRSIATAFKNVIGKGRRSRLK